MSLVAQQGTADWKLGSQAILSAELVNQEFPDLDISPVIILIDARADASLYSLAAATRLTVIELSPGVITPHIVGQLPTELLRDAAFRLAEDLLEDQC